MDKRDFKALIIPNITWNKKTLTDTFGELIAQPLETGFGTTLGNGLRRILLGGVEGTAVTSVIIKGINNEFSPLPGVIEDAMQLILNIKNIIVRSKDGNVGTMKLSMRGTNVVRVADIVAGDNIELINQEYILAHLASDGELEIDFFVENGRGYRLAKWPADKALQEDNRVYLDASFSPVRKVTFDVEKTRVGKDIDYDRLVLQIHTNGSENPVHTVHYAVSILRTQLEHFLAEAEIPFNDISALPDEPRATIGLTELENSGIKGSLAELLLKPIEELELSARAQNCLINAGIKHIIDLVNLSEDEGLKIKNFGRKSLNEVKESMQSLGLFLGMKIPENELKVVMMQQKKDL